jgi:hypothetical protein
VLPTVGVADADAADDADDDDDAMGTDGSFVLSRADARQSGRQADR